MNVIAAEIMWWFLALGGAGVLVVGVYLYVIARGDDNDSDNDYFI